MIVSRKRVHGQRTHLTTKEHPSLVAQVRPTSSKNEKVWWTVSTSYVPPHCTVQSKHITVSCQMTHYITVWVAIIVVEMVMISYLYILTTLNCRRYWSASHTTYRNSTIVCKCESYANLQKEVVQLSSCNFHLTGIPLIMAFKQPTYLKTCTHVATCLLA